MKGRIDTDVVSDEEKEEEEPLEVDHSFAIFKIRSVVAVCGDALNDFIKEF